MVVKYFNFFELILLLLPTVLICNAFSSENGKGDNFNTKN